MSLDKKTVANRYAKAIFELAEENGQLDQTYQELSALRQVFEENGSLAALLSGVDLSLAEKKSLIDALKKDASPFVSNLIQMVFDYGRMDDLVAIIDEFERRYDAFNKRIHAEVITAVQLDTKQRDQLKAGLSKRLSANEIVLHETVDPSILGGVIIRANNETLDGSLSSKIEQIRRLLVK
ncbi:ATP synthase F1 subunit delta [Limosilactobacillus mucosae]|uniref:ATP synthase F1 subunit delta n=1 Tax=Limosilactobacillus mucosae TaxID=97478 RepID=UPI003EBDFB23